jgi:tRNA (adenine57-N1/adenine58-N1)-methyltransferase
MKIAEKNIKKAGVSKYVTQHNLDLKTAKKIFAICPTMNQLEKLTIALIENEFTDIESTEHIIRNIEAREGKTRHSFQGIGHTTYLCFARKAFFGRDSRKSDKKSKTTVETKKIPVTTAKKTATKPTKKTATKPTKKTATKPTKKTGVKQVKKSTHKSS